MAPIRPRLKEIAAESSQALARLDAERLERLAAECEALRHEVNGMRTDELTALSAEAYESSQAMRAFFSVLEATSANLNVLANLSHLRSGQLEYGRIERVRTECGRTKKF